MDPTANLNEQRRLAAIINDPEATHDPQDALQLAELVEALDEWISGGGYLPSQWTDRTFSVAVLWGDKEVITVGRHAGPKLSAKGEIEALVYEPHSRSNVWASFTRATWRKIS